MVSRSDRKQVIQDYHHHYHHPSIKYTLKLLADDFIGLECAKIVTLFVTGCQICQRFGQDYKKKAGHMEPRHIFNNKQIAWSMGLCGTTIAICHIQEQIHITLAGGNHKNSTYTELPEIKASKTIIRELDQVFHQFWISIIYTLRQRSKSF